MPRRDQGTRHRPAGRGNAPLDGVHRSRRRFLLPLEEIVPLADGVRIALTTAFPTRRTVRAASAAGAWAIHPEHRKTTTRLVDAAHDAGLRVNAWTVNTAGPTRAWNVWESTPFSATIRDLLRPALDPMLFCQINQTCNSRTGEMAEWLKAHAWKACIGNSIEGSNPSLSARTKSTTVQQCAPPDGKTDGLLRADPCIVRDRVVRST